MEENTVNTKVRVKALSLLKESETLTLPRILIGLQNSESESTVISELKVLVSEEIINYEGGTYSLKDNIDYDALINDLSELIIQGKDDKSTNLHAFAQKIINKIDLILVIWIAVCLLFNILGTYLIYASWLAGLVFNILGLVGLLFPTLVYGLELPQKNPIKITSFALMTGAIFFHVLGMIIAFTATSTGGVAAGVVIGTVALACQITVLVFAILKLTKK